MIRLSFFIDNPTRSVLGINSDNVNKFTLCSWVFGDEIIVSSSDGDKQDNMMISDMNLSKKNDNHRNSDTFENVVCANNSLEFGLKWELIDLKKTFTTTKSFVSIFISRDWENMSKSESNIISKNQKKADYDVDDISSSSSKLVSINMSLDYIFSIIKNFDRYKPIIFGLMIPLCDFDSFQEEKDNSLHLQNTDISNIGSIYVIVEYNNTKFEQKSIYSKHSLQFFDFGTGYRIIKNCISKHIKFPKLRNSQTEYVKCLIDIVSEYNSKNNRFKNVEYWFEDFGDILYETNYLILKHSNVSKQIQKILSSLNIKFEFIEGYKENDSNDNPFFTMTTEDMDNFMWMLNYYKSKEWFKTAFTLNRYLKGRLSEKSSNGTLTLYYTNFECVIKKIKSNVHENMNSENKKDNICSMHKLKFRADTPKLCQFERFYWTFNNQKIPYPHITKIFVPQIKISSPTKIDSITKQKSNKISLTLPLSQIFEKSISVSCWKMGLKDDEFQNIIKECFLIKKNDNGGYDDIFYNDYDDIIISHEHGSKWLSENSKSRYDLMQCMRCMTDFLSSVSCSLKYKSDRRIIRADTENKSVGIIYDIDSLDFEFLMGLNQEGDCDEAGLAIDIVYSLMFQVPILFRDDKYKNVFPNLRCMSFLVMNFVDFFTFSNVDTPKLESDLPMNVPGNFNITSKSNREMKLEFLNSSDDVFYNKKDFQNDCKTGHSSVIIWPTVHVLKAYTETIDTYPKKDFDWGSVFLGECDTNKDSVKNKLVHKFQQNSFCKIFGKKIGMNMPNYSLIGNNKSCTICKSAFLTKLLLCVLPRIPIEGTGPQDALMLNLSSYYMDPKTEIEMIENEELTFLNTIDSDLSKREYIIKNEINIPRILIDLQSKVLQSMKIIFSLESMITKKMLVLTEEFLSEIHQINKNDHPSDLFEHLKMKYKRNEKYISSKTFDITFHQTKKYSSDIFFEDTDFSPRITNFYRRSVLCTSQKLRYLFNNEEKLDNKNILPLFEAMYWVNMKKMSWGVPMKEILEISQRYPNNESYYKFANVIPIPSSLYRALDYHDIRESQTKILVSSDPILEQCLSDRVVSDRKLMTPLEQGENDIKNELFLNSDIIKWLPKYFVDEISKDDNIIKKLESLNENFIEGSSLLQKIGWSKKPLQNFFIQKKCIENCVNLNDDKDIKIYVYKLKLIEQLFNNTSEDIELLISFKTNKTFTNFKKDFIVRFQFFAK